MLNVRLASDHLYGKLLFTWLSLVLSLMVSFFSHDMSWMRSGTELSQFLRVFLPTLVHHYHFHHYHLDESISSSMGFLMDIFSFYLILQKNYSEQTVEVLHRCHILHCLHIYVSKRVSDHKRVDGKIFFKAMILEKYTCTNIDVSTMTKSK